MTRQVGKFEPSILGSIIYLLCFPVVSLTYLICKAGEWITRNKRNG